MANGIFFAFSTLIPAGAADRDGGNLPLAPDRCAASLFGACCLDCGLVSLDRLPRPAPRLPDDDDWEDLGL
jgi:hypothetical protein